MDDTIQEEWPKWVEDAPPDWRSDGWLTSHQPITVTCKYGQDQHIGDAEQATTWNRERDYGDVRFLSFAIATDLR